ncbi:MAG: Y-family DNA polymerase [Gemmatimonadaceae bacterium]
MSERRILLADADAFFVAVARMIDPDGAGKAALLIVGGSRESRGVVCSASYETRKFGVRSAMPIARALRLCPDAMCVPVPRKACLLKSREIRVVLERFAPIVASASIDEWYLDLTGTERVYRGEPLAATAQRIRGAVFKETGLSISIGGGRSKLLAKLAAERAKPKQGTGAGAERAGVFIVEPGSEDGFMRTLALADLPLVGPKFQRRLAALGMTQVADVLRHDLALLRGLLGERLAEWLWDRVRGIDTTEVEPHGDAKSISRDETFPKDLSSDSELERELLSLVTRGARDLRSQGLAARTIAVRIRDKDFRTRSARRTLLMRVVSDRVIMRVARKLLAKLRAARRVPARLLGFSLSSLAQDDLADQLTLFAKRGAAGAAVETTRDRRVSRAVDRVREKFGERGIMPAALTRNEDRSAATARRSR